MHSNHHDPILADLESLAAKNSEEREQLEAKLYELNREYANRALESLRPWWQARFPRIRLKLIFDMGVVALVIGDDSRRAMFEDGKIVVGPPATYPDFSDRYRRPYACLQPLADVLGVVEDMTCQYANGAPDDFVVEPVIRD